LSKHRNSRRNVHKNVKIQLGIKHVENKDKCTVQKQKTREIQYKILNEENKIWRIIPGHLTV